MYLISILIPKKYFAINVNILKIHDATELYLVWYRHKGCQANNSKIRVDYEIFAAKGLSIIDWFSIAHRRL